METITLALECDVAISDSLATALENATGSEVIVATKNNLDGSPETALQIVKVVSELATTVMPVLMLYLGQKKIRKIKVGEMEIENPTQEECELLLKERTAKRQASKRR